MQAIRSTAKMSFISVRDWIKKVYAEIKLKNIIIVEQSQSCIEALEYSYK